MFELPPQWAMNEAMGSAPELGSHDYKKEYTLVVGDSPLLTLPRAVAQYTRLEDAQGVTARVNFALSGYPLETSVTASFDVAPPMLLSVEPKVEWFRLSQNSRGEVFRCSIKNYMPHKTAGKIRCLAPAGWRTEIGTFVLEKEDSATTVGILVQPPDSASTGDYQLRFRSDYWADDVTARISDVSLPRMGPVGIIQSYDSTLSMVLHALGAEYRQLGHEDLEVGNLSAFVTIIVDMRAYLVREDLRKFNDRLLEYVKRGGNLVVMYQREKEWKPEYAPYPFRIGHGRVCDEDAPVRVLEPEHPLLNLPNKITDSDWNGWKQERGIYFPTDVGREYTELVSTHDPAESPLTTGYLTVWWGKGTYVYSSLVWYRQLRDMHPGALRCFANMISYPFYRK